MTNIRVRFFAAARAAAGTDETRVTVPAGTSVAGALAILSSGQPPLADVVSRCSFLVNGVALTNPAHPLADDDLVDVMPPFAGG